jgi:hypothetical protein
VALFLRKLGVARKPVRSASNSCSRPRDGVSRGLGSVEDRYVSLVARLVKRVGEVGRKSEPLLVLGWMQSRRSF